MDLQSENKHLKEQLALAKNFINREIVSHMKSISSQKIEYTQSEKRENFFDKNIEEMIIGAIQNYFGEEMLLTLDTSMIENIISAEVFYHNLLKNNFLDGVSIINSYQKAIDFLIEKNITSLFRKFAKTKHVPLVKNDLDEKNLHSIVEKGYSLGFTRLFSIIHNIREGKTLYDYGTTFYNFLEKYSYIREILLSQDFYKLAKFLADSEVFGNKRHEGKITLKEVKTARKLIIGDFQDTNSLMYKFVQIG